MYPTFMNQSEVIKYFKDAKGIAGWFSSHDAFMFHVLLSMQSLDKVDGDLLEIGVFEGKSSVLLGRHLKKNEEFHACDIFSELTDSKNAEEIRLSYPNLSRKIFESNMLQTLGHLPEIHQCPSSQLQSKLGNRKFRFIHIDGSHLYVHVKLDLDYAAEAIAIEKGIIAVDDFRTQHAIGVTAAVWEKIIAGRLTPFAITPAKIYLSKPNWTIDTEKLASALEELGIQSVIEEFLGFKVLRTIGLSDEELYSKKSKITSLIPPILANLIRNSYLWKRFRNL